MKRSLWEHEDANANEVAFGYEVCLTARLGTLRFIFCEAKCFMAAKPPLHSNEVSTSLSLAPPQLLCYNTPKVVILCTTLLLCGYD